MEQSAVLRARRDGVTDLSVAAIRARLAALGPSPTLSDIGISDSLVAEADVLSAAPGREAWRPGLESTRPAGVLVPLVERESGLTVLLTRRTDHLHHHAGQISFPGGRKEDDDPSIEATALREAREEIGLDSRLVTVIGVLPQYVTLTRFAITPVVGLVTPPFDLRPDPLKKYPDSGDSSKGSTPVRIALFQPDIPQNVAAVARLAACFGIGLDVIGPEGFVWDAQKLRRVGMDYLDAVEIVRHPGWAGFRAACAGRLVLLSTKAAEPLPEFAFRADDVLLFGRESAGVPDEVHAAADARVVIP